MYDKIQKNEFKKNYEFNIKIDFEDKKYGKDFFSKDNLNNSLKLLDKISISQYKKLYTIAKKDLSDQINNPDLATRNIYTSFYILLHSAKNQKGVISIIKKNTNVKDIIENINYNNIQK
jgi:hypothetical protein